MALIAKTQKVSSVTTKTIDNNKSEKLMMILWMYYLKKEIITQRDKKYIMWKEGD